MGDVNVLEIASVTLATHRDSMPAMETFYCGLLGLPRPHDDERDALVVGVGSARLEFVASAIDARPFYHFALLVPGNRFAAAHAWVASRTDLLSRPSSDATVFDFDFWDAQACYFHDPAGNIVEFIAHRGLAEVADVTDPFSASELVGISEIGIVTPDPGAEADTLHRDLGIDIWSGGVDGADSLAFVGRKAHTLILCRPGRGWLPTGRPAEVHPVDITLAGARNAETTLNGPYQIRLNV